MNKKITSLILCAGLAFSAQLAPLAAPDTEYEIYKTDFSDFAGGASQFNNWSFNGDALPWFTGSRFEEDSAASVTAGNDIGQGGFMQLVSTPADYSDNEYSGAKFKPDMPLDTGVYRLEFKAKTAANSAARMLIRARDDENKVSDDLFMLGSDGCVKDVAQSNANVGIGMQGLALKLNSGVWQTVELIINADNGEVMCFVDGHGAYRTNLGGIDGVSEILFAANNDSIAIDDFLLSAVESDENYIEADQSGFVYKTNFSEFIDYRSNGANPGALTFLNWKFENAAWRGHAYGAKTDRGVSFKIADTDGVTYSKLTNGYVQLPETLTTGTYTIEFYEMYNDAASIFKIQLGDDPPLTDVFQINGDGGIGLPKGSALKCASGEWNKVELVVNLDNDTVTAFVNERCAGQTSYSRNLSRVWYNVNPGAYHGDIYIDDLAVYKDNADYADVTPEGYIFYDNFSSFTDYESDGSDAAQNFGSWKMGNAAWRGGVYGAKTDKGISLKMADALNITSPNQWNDAEYVLDEPKTGGRYILELEEMYHGDITAPFTIQLKDTENDTNTSFTFGGDGKIIGGINLENGLVPEQWNKIELHFDLDAKTADIYVNGIIAKSLKDIEISQLNSVLLNTKTTDNAPESRGDVYIDNFGMKPYTEKAPLTLTKTETGALLEFASDTGCTAVAAAYDENGVLLGVKTEYGTSGAVELARPEGVYCYKAFMWSAFGGEGGMTPLCESVTLYE